MGLAAPAAAAESPRALGLGDPAPSDRGTRISAWGENVNGLLDLAAAEALGWRTGADAGTDSWEVADGYDMTSPLYDRKAFRGTTASSVTDIYLITPTMTIGTASTLTFYHDYNFESGYDGGVFEISVAGGAWTDLGSLMLAGGYTGTITGSTSPINGQAAWTGEYQGTEPEHFDQVRVDLASFAGNSVRFRWRLTCDSSLGGNQFWYIDNISITSLAAQPTPFFTARYGPSNNGGQPSVTLEWVNPAGDAGLFQFTRIILKSAPTPGDPNEGTVLYESTLTGQKDLFVHEPVNLGQTYYYSAWVFDGVDLLNADSWSIEKTATATTFATTDNPRWAYFMGSSTFAPPGIGSIMGLDNDKGVHSMRSDPAAESDGGSWPAGWEPIAMGGPSQARPLVVTIPFPTTPTKVIFVASQDGKVYAIDGSTGGANNAPPLWVSEDFGTLQGGVAGIFTAFGGSYDLLFVGSHNVDQANTFYALDPFTGATLFSFSGGGNTIDGIASSAAVDYETNRVYFTSRSFNETEPSVWCLGFNGTSFTPVTGFPRAVGTITAGPAFLGNFDGDGPSRRLYVGNDTSTVYALSADNGATIWSRQLSVPDGAIKGFISVDPASPGANETYMYMSTTNAVWSVVDQGADGTEVWREDAVGQPSTPLFAINANELYIGSSDGFVYRLDPQGGGVIGSVQIGDASSTVGSPSLDPTLGRLYVGAESGAYYSIDLPFN